jgi:hypothetical protein
LVEERETRYRVDTLLARLMDNIPGLARPADAPAPWQSHEKPAQEPAEGAASVGDPTPEQTNFAVPRIRGGGGC